MRWFGAPWGAPINTDAEQATTPVGDQCAYCRQPIGSRDQGLLIPHRDSELQIDEDQPWHLDCFLRAVGVKR